MRRKGLDLVLSVMSMLWVALSDPVPVIGMLLALPLVFVLPGYTLTEAMFHKRPLEASHRLLLSLALSLAIDILRAYPKTWFWPWIEATSDRFSDKL